MEFRGRGVQLIGARGEFESRQLRICLGVNVLYSGLKVRSVLAANVSQGGIGVVYL